MVKHVEDIDNADLTQALLQTRDRRRSHTVTARHQTDRLAGHTCVNTVDRVNSSDITSVTNDAAATS